MSRLRSGQLVLVVMLGLIALIIGGCGGSTGSRTGGAPVSISLISDSVVYGDMPISSFGHASISITSIEAQPIGGGPKVIKTFSTPLAVNLKDHLTRQTAQPLGSAMLDVGRYSSIVLRLSSAVNDGGAQVNLGPIAANGMACGNDFVISPGNNSLIVYFSADRSLGSQSNPVLKPAVFVVSQSNGAEVIGSLVTREGWPYATPPGGIPTLEFYVHGHIGDPNYFVAQTFVGNAGSFDVPVLPSGTYDIAVPCGNPVCGVVVTAPKTDLGTLLVN